MNRVGRHIAVAGLCVFSVALGSSGCADSQSMIFVRQVQARVQKGTSGCAVDNNPTSIALTEGVLDVAFASEYHASLLVGSQLVARGNASQVRSETARVTVQGSEVTLLDAQGKTAWGPITVPGSGFIDPATGSDPAFGVTNTILLGASLGQTLHNDLQGTPGVLRRFVAHVKVFGETLGGTAVESGEWEFPLTVCYGCLVSFPADANDPKSAVQPNCNAAAMGTGTTTPCNLGQDDGIDCRICKLAINGAALCEP
jgi:hypothetical protein